MAVKTIAMRKLLFILVSFILLATTACNGGKPGETDAVTSSGTGGGSVKMDSVQAVGSGVNSQSANNLNISDTILKSHSSVVPASDTLNKQKP